ncbi:MAG: (d)CMP kinase [Flavobacteriales bacterium]|nr:(d)CMP kinase [Flavobacteriales bacterium]
MNRITIAIDGFSSCGKSTLAKQLAQHLGYVYIDSGAMYRAVALFVMENGLVVDGRLDEDGLLGELDGIDIRFQHDPMTDKSATYLNGRNVEQEIRTLEVSNHVTLVSPVPEVRAKLVKLQQAFGREKGVVMDGRDIGTVVFPDAEVKLYMTARPEVRAQRRFHELRLKGSDVSFAEVEANIHQRDLDDTTRKADPLTKAADAIEIDNSDITAEQQFRKALDIVLGVLAQVGQE